jgi:dihydrodipicolinate synthase/N-acetylneuraminate lyase
LYQTLIEAYRRDDRQQAAELQALAVRMIDVLVGSGAPPVATFKWFMSWLCGDCGPSRLPLVDPTDKQIASLKSRLDGTGILDWVARSNPGSCPGSHV